MSRAMTREDSVVGVSERRVHRRMGVRLPVEMRRAGEGEGAVARTVTQNISTGGMYVSLESPSFRRGDRLRVSLTLPPGDGVSSYEGRASCAAEVVRVEPSSDTRSVERGRYGVAARFLERLRLSFPE